VSSKERVGEPEQGGAVPATVMGQLAWHTLVHGGWDEIAARYLFDTRALTNKRPYFAAYVKPGDLPRVTDRLELLQDEWGYLLLWATLARDVRNRQQVPRQVAESGLNAVLVAPQFAVDALDSSAGRFWEPGVFAQFLSEAGERLTELHGDARVRGAFHAAPVVIAAYSGGYQPAAFVLHSGGADDRLRGVALFDALYGEYDKFADWLGKRPPAFFVSTFGKAAREQNATLQRMLTERGVRLQTALPARLTRGSAAFVAASDDVRHVDFMTTAWVDDPLKVVLRRIPGFARAGGAPAGATGKPR
jgi:hypothetical protein